MIITIGSYILISLFHFEVKILYRTKYRVAKNPIILEKTSKYLEFDNLG